MQDHASHVSVCPNCATEAGGEFCPRCGQKRTHQGDLGLAHAWHHLLHETLHLDGRVFGSLRLLFLKPGQLTLDFLEGRRARHVHPLRMFLVISALFFVFSSGPMVDFQWRVDGAALGDKQAVAATGLLKTPAPRVERHLRHKAEREGLSYEMFMERAQVRLRSVFKVAFTVAVVANGFWLFLLFRRERPYLAEHLVMALHTSCFGMSVALMLEGVRALTGHDVVRGATIAVPTFLYFMLAARLVYGARGRKVVVAAVLKMLTAILVVGLSLAFFLWRLLS